MDEGRTKSPNGGCCRRDGGGDRQYRLCCGDGDGRAGPGGGPLAATARTGDAARSGYEARIPDATAPALALAAKDPRENVTVTVHRGGQTLTVQVTLGELPGG